MDAQRNLGADRGQTHKLFPLFTREENPPIGTNVDDLAGRSLKTSDHPRIRCKAETSRDRDAHRDDSGNLHLLPNVQAEVPPASES